MNPNDKPAEQNTQNESPQQDKTLGRHDETAKTDMPVFKPNGRPHTLRVFVIIIIILLLVLAGLFGWLWWQERNDDEQESASSQTMQEESSQEQTGSTCPENFGIYANQSLGMEFCYPTAWGEVEVSDAKFAADDTGSRWRLGFTEKSQVNLGLVSEDWSTEIARDGTCADPAVQVLPEFSPFSIEWNVETEIDTEPPQPSSAARGIEIEEGEYLIEERVDDLFTIGACITGYTIIDNETYPFVTSTYHYGPVDDVPVQMYMDNPEDYVSSANRADFATFVKSIKAYEE